MQGVFELNRPNPAAQNPLSLENALARCRHRGHPLRTIIDVGASDGSWSATAKQFYPQAHCHLIEAQPLHEPALRQLAAARADFTYALAAASEDRKSTRLNSSH